MATADRFVRVRAAKGLLKGSGAVAMLKPPWAKANGIRCGKTKQGVYLYSVKDLTAFVERVVQERQEAALESDDVRLWRLVVDTASADGNRAAESWANGHLLTAIAESEDSILNADAITLE